MMSHRYLHLPSQLPYGVPRSYVVMALATNRTLHHSPLTQHSFSTFGTVIENASPPVLTPISHLEHAQAVLANQNTAIKYLDVTVMKNSYTQSPSQKPGNPVMNMFACFPRELVTPRTGDSPVFPIRVLERHPYTTQTFIPLGLSAIDSATKYLVIVAPTGPSTADFPELGPPDLDNLRAFLAHGGQAVTYGSGTWHAPMVVVGEKRIDFVVIQFCNGVPMEDCQEVEIANDLAVAVTGLGLPIMPLENGLHI